MQHPYKKSKLIVKTTIYIFTSTLFGVIYHQFFKNLYIELSEIRISDVIGVMGTLYSLITAFILVTVWSHFTSTENVFAEEANALVSLWNFCDYLNSEETTNKMKPALINYIDSTLNSEFDLLRNQKPVKYPSKELIAIIRVIDKIKFDDPRDPIAFESIMHAYQKLATARSQRIKHCKSQMPGMLRVFYITASFFFWFGYLIDGFESFKLYIIILFSVSVLVFLSYIIIHDMDNPLSGALQISFEDYITTKEFIIQTKHEV
ncbi:MAG: DUF4239 domain-containing protein [Candidatus Heimdallarchaeota archaeon]|nr:DUF4239 domain-containing protein [Candidatus Heimdallarchaeota archaeon]MDH5645755.1 DUF4239 domain-containing protein [Candidatus Heimdallarchaeota archaeon]